MTLTFTPPLPTRLPTPTPPPSLPSRLSRSSPFLSSILSLHPPSSSSSSSNQQHPVNRKGDRVEWNDHSVIHSRSGNVVRRYTFPPDSEAITSAILARFPSRNSPSTSRSSGRERNEVTKERREMDSVWGSHKRPLLSNWSDDPLPLPDNPLPHSPPSSSDHADKGKGTEEALVVLQGETLIIYSQSSTPFIISIPPSRRLRALSPHGVILDEKNVLLDPYEAVIPVDYKDGEELIWVSGTEEGTWRIGISRLGGQLRIWEYPSPSSLYSSASSSKGKGKGKSTDPLPRRKRKRSSLHPSHPPGPGPSTTTSNPSIPLLDSNGVPLPIFPTLPTDLDPTISEEERRMRRGSGTGNGNGNKGDGSMGIDRMALGPDWELGNDVDVEVEEEVVWKREEVYEMDWRSDGLPIISLVSVISSTSALLAIHDTTCHQLQFLSLTRSSPTSEIIATPHPPIPNIKHAIPILSPLRGGVIWDLISLSERGEWKLHLTPSISLLITPPSPPFPLEEIIRIEGEGSLINFITLPKSGKETRFHSTLRLTSGGGGGGLGGAMKRIWTVLSGVWEEEDVKMLLEVAPITWEDLEGFLLPRSGGEDESMDLGEEGGSSDFELVLKHVEERPYDRLLSSLSHCSSSSQSKDLPSIPIEFEKKERLERATEVLHFLAEDLKLSPETMGDWEYLAKIVMRCAASLGWNGWVDWYARRLGVFPPPSLSSPAFAVNDYDYDGKKRKEVPPSIETSISHRIPYQLPVLHSSIFRIESPSDPFKTTRSILLAFQKGVSSIPLDSWKEQKWNWSLRGLLGESIRAVQLDPNEDRIAGGGGEGGGYYEVAGRRDLEVLASGGRGIRKRPVVTSVPEEPLSLDEIITLAKEGSLPIAKKSTRKEGDVTAVVPTATRFNEDKRLEEAETMLQFWKPVTVSPGDRSLDQLTPQVQQSILNSLSNRTLALPAGYGMLALHHTRGSTAPHEAVPIPRICTSARILPMTSPVAVLEKERDPTSVSHSNDRMEWPEFHSGVSAALALPKGEDEFDSAQISFNKPTELTPRHAGFLLGLGLTGRLAAIEFNQAFEYLKTKHDPTSVGILLGLAVSYIGTGDEKVTSLLSVHLAALHPPNSSPLMVSGMIQAAGLVGVGLVHVASKKRSLADAMIRELCGIKIVDIEDPTSCREAYALSAGFAFGFIMLGKGKEPGSTAGEVQLLKTLRALILGENNHQLPGAAPSNHITDVNITSSAATIAIGLMYLRTERQDVADMLEIPDTARRLDYVRSDLLMLRTIARSLIMFEGINYTRQWVESHVPKFINDVLGGTKPSVHGKVFDSDLDVARWNIIAGACLAVGLRYAGTAAAEAHSTLIHYVDRLTRASFVKVSTVQGKIKRHAIRCCLSVCCVALSMVMAGTGELNVMRRLRVAHGHFSEGVTYGTHLASHMALGMLFVGGGHYTLGTSDLAIASLLLAFYPAFPSAPYENRAHLQVFRHLWILAVEPRCSQVRDVDTDELTFLPIRLRLIDKDNVVVGSKQLVAPTLIPELKHVSSISVDSPRYWPFSLNLSDNSIHRESFLRTGTMYVKRRTGHLSYARDPRGIKSIFTRSKSETGSAVFDLGEVSRTLSSSATSLRDFVEAFTDDREAIEAVRWLCHAEADGKTPTAFEAFSASALLECLTRDKRDTIGTYLSMFRAASYVESGDTSPIVLRELEQLLLVLDVYKRGVNKTVGPSTTTNPPATPGGSSKQKHKSAAMREPLVEKPFRAYVYQRLVQHTKRFLSESEGEKALEDYLLHSRWPREQKMSGRLAMFLLVQHAPDLGVMEDLRVKMRSAGLETAEERYLVLKAVGKQVEKQGAIPWGEEWIEAAVKAWSS